MRTFLLTLFAMFGFLVWATAQTTAGVEMADGLRASGMIYVVVAVIALIVLGMLIFLFGMDRRMAKLEKSAGKKN